MPTPIGHSLFGYAVYARWVRGKSRWQIALFALFVVAASLPDIDLVIGLFSGDADLFHHQYTHSFFFCAVSALVLGLMVHAIGGSGLFRGIAAMAAILFSHLLLDAVTLDTTPPYGQMLLWPFSDRYLHVPFAIFQDIQRIGSRELFFRSLLSRHNMLAVMVEIAILSTLGFLIIYTRSPGVRKGSP